MPQRPNGNTSTSPTLLDVARLAGVSPSTVSRVINEPALVRQDTTEAVRRAIAQIGYTPNFVAGGLASNRSRLVAVVVPTIANSIFADTVQAINDTLSGGGYQTLVGLTGYDTAHEDELLLAILGRRPDGLILTGTVHSSASRKRLIAAAIPTVQTWDLGAAPVDMAVGFSHAEVGRATARHLHGRGHRRIGLVFATDQRAQVREAALRDELVRLGCAAPAVAHVPPANAVAFGRSGLRELMAGGARFDAVACSSDALALGVISEAAASGINVPDELAVMGFGDLDFGGFTSPALTTVHIDRAEIGRMAAGMLLSELAGQRPGDHVRDVGFSIVVRESA